MRINAHLSFAGQCEAAFRFYEECLGGRIECLLRNEEAPSSGAVPPEWGPKIAHATLMLGDQRLTGGDVPSGFYQEPQGFSVLLNIESPEEAERVFARLAEKGKIHMPLQATYWTVRFGILVDQFGIPWTINCSSTSP